MKGFPLLSTYIFLVGVFLHLSEGIDIQCNESDALLKISFSRSIVEPILRNCNPGEGYKNYSCTPTLNIFHSKAAGNTSVSYYQLLDKYIEDYSTCLTREHACFFVRVTKLPNLAYEISWDGNVMEHGPQFQDSFWGKNETVTEIGNACVPICDQATEALFEFKYYMRGQFDKFRLEDNDGNMIFGCVSNDCYHLYDRDLSHVYNHRACLPKENTCYSRERRISHSRLYQFVIGDGYDLLMGTYSISYDGQLLHESHQWFFKSTRFGQGCTPICNPDTESVVEFIMDRRVYGKRVNGSMVLAEYEKEWARDFSWELRMRKDDALLSSGVIPGATDISLTHKQICVPKESCLYFKVQTPDRSAGSAAMYSLTLNDVTYRADAFYYDQLSKITYMGECAGQSPCNETNETLFELTLHTMGNKPPIQLERDIGKPSSWYVEWWLIEKAVEGPLHQNLLRSKAFLGADSLFSIYYADTTYGVRVCVPKEECLFMFGMMTDSSVENYTVKRNGYMLSDRTDHLSGKYEDLTTTDFGCSVTADAKDDKMFVGTILGIVIARVAVLV